MIRKAVIPAAGLGTRFLPATKAQPKEMLPIIDTPTIQYVVQEAVDAGIEDILIISGKGKRAIEDHFDRNYELESRLQEKGEEKWYQEMRRISEMANIHFIRQKELLGLGDAIYHARMHTENEPFAVLLGDTVVDSVIPAVQQLMDIYEQYQSTVIGVEAVPKDKVMRYGIVGGKKLSDRLIEMDAFIEKPSPREAPSNMAVMGRYILTPDVYPALEKTKRGKGNEIQLTDAIRQLVDKAHVYAFAIDGKRFDIGNKLDYLKTQVLFALKHQEFAKPMRAFLKECLK